MTYTIKPVYVKLRAMGFKTKQVKAYLPDWWDDSIANTEAGYQQALWLFSNTFNIDFKSLISSINTKDIPEYRNSYHYKFKYSCNQSKDKLQAAVSVALLASKLTLSAYDKPLYEFNTFTADSIRKQLLSEGNDWIDFSVLTNYCWSLGIPVIHIEEMPSPKMHGLAIQKEERPIIVLTKKDAHGHLVFDLAHELGHIILGHVAEKGMMLDEKINKSNPDALETEANAFALELLNGKNVTKFEVPKGISPPRLVKYVLGTAFENNIDPLHIILNYGYTYRKFAFANQILKLLVKELGLNKTDQEVAQQAYLDNVDTSSLLDEEVIERIIGVYDCSI